MNKNDTETLVVEADEISTMEAAQLLGLAVRSVQMMVDRGELQAWKTPGGHRRISRRSVLQWRDGERQGTGRRNAPAMELKLPSTTGKPTPDIQDPGVLLIEDSQYFQKVVTLVMQRHFPDVRLRVAGDAVTGLVMVGALRPDVLVVDILLPGMDGVTLITNLRANPQFSDMELIVITSLGAVELEPFAMALQGIPVIHKPSLMLELPERLRKSLRR